jgi:Zn-dependent protease/predicted transcriptional regulator
MRGNISLGRVFGISLRLHYTWFIIFALVTYQLVRYAAGQAYSLEQGIILGILTSILFFASIITHELAHSIVATRNSIPVREITLFVFGGVSQITREATRPRVEFLVAVVGPLTSLVLAGIFYGLHLLLAGTQQELAASLMQWLALINVILAVFNLIPGFPLDGGRIFRALVWKRTGDYRKATRIAARFGQVIAYAFIAGGFAVIVFVRPLWFSGLWFILIGWFLHDAARASYQQILLRDALEGVTARQVTDHSCPVVSPDITIEEVVQAHVLPTGRGCLLVGVGDEFRGMVTAQQMRKVRRADWAQISVRDVMTPAARLKTVDADLDILSVLQEMDAQKTDQIAVTESGKPFGVVNRDNLIRFLRTRAAFGTRSGSGSG